MKLGAFSVSLAVKDIAASKTFYTNLGFAPAGGDETQGWLILRNGDTVIGLFQGMFDKNMMTFNPGWSQSADNLDSFTDIRNLQKQLSDAGIEIVNPADESTTGPASFTVIDPDGNPILIDQHR